MMPLTAKKRAANQVQGTPILSVMARLADEAQVRRQRRRLVVESNAGRQLHFLIISFPNLKNRCSIIAAIALRLQEVDNLEQELARGVAQAAASRKRQRSGGVKDDDGDDDSLMGDDDVYDDKEGGKWKDEEEGGGGGSDGDEGQQGAAAAGKGKKPMGKAQRTAMLEQAVEAG